MEQELFQVSRKRKFYQAAEVSHRLPFGTELNAKIPGNKNSKRETWWIFPLVIV